MKTNNTIHRAIFRFDAGEFDKAASLFRRSHKKGYLCKMFATPRNIVTVSVYLAQEEWLDRQGRPYTVEYI